MCKPDLSSTSTAAGRVFISCHCESSTVTTPPEIFTDTICTPSKVDDAGYVYACDCQESCNSVLDVQMAGRHDLGHDRYGYSCAGFCTDGKSPCRPNFDISTETITGGGDDHYQAFRTVYTLKSCDCAPETCLPEHEVTFVTEVEDKNGRGEVAVCSKATSVTASNPALAQTCSSKKDPNGAVPVNVKLAECHLSSCVNVTGSKGTDTEIASEGCAITGEGSSTSPLQCRGSCPLTGKKCNAGRNQDQRFTCTCDSTVEICAYKLVFEACCSEGQRLISYATAHQSATHAFDATYLSDSRTTGGIKGETETNDATAPVSTCLPKIGATPLKFEVAPRPRGIKTRSDCDGAAAPADSASCEGKDRAGCMQTDWCEWHQNSETCWELPCPFEEQRTRRAGDTQPPVIVAGEPFGHQITFSFRVDRKANIADQRDFEKAPSFPSTSDIRPGSVTVEDYFDSSEGRSDMLVNEQFSKPKVSGWGASYQPQNVLDATNLGLIQSAGPGDPLTGSKSGSLLSGRTYNPRNLHDSVHCFHFQLMYYPTTADFNSARVVPGSPPREMLALRRRAYRGYRVRL